MPGWQGRLERLLILMKDDIKASIEAILFASGEKVESAALTSLLNIDENELDELIQEMLLDYAEQNRGIQMISDGSGYCLCTKPNYADMVAQAVRPVNRRLSSAAMETLAIIAYRQPVNKVEIEGIRGVKSDHVLARLLEKGLIEEVGYARLPGKPILYGTTFEFLKVFGIASLEELPDMELLSGQGETDNGEQKI